MERRVRYDLRLETRNTRVGADVTRCVSGFKKAARVTHQMHKAPLLLVDLNEDLYDCESI